MTITNDSRSYSTPSADYIGGPLFGGADIFAGILVILMILGPMAAGATHANRAGWDSDQREQSSK